MSCHYHVTLTGFDKISCYIVSFIMERPLWQQTVSRHATTKKKVKPYSTWEAEFCQWPHHCGSGSFATEPPRRDNQTLASSCRGDLEEEHQAKPHPYSLPVPTEIINVYCLKELSWWKYCDIKNRSVIDTLRNHRDWCVPHWYIYYLYLDFQINVYFQLILIEWMNESNA